MTRRFHPVFLPILAALALPLTVGGAPENPKPNFVFILTDNQGAWTLGCYGNPDIQTPHIDRLAAEGIRFTRALSSNPVCSPTRATFLTGLLPSQHGVHCYIENRFMMGPNARNLIEEFDSIGKIMHAAGYVCGLSGKWHLGDHLRPAEGFRFWTTKPAGHTHEFYDQEVIEDGVVRKEAGYTTDFWTRKGIQFMEQNKDRPFFLFLAYNGPYNLGGLMGKPARNRWAAHYKDKHFKSFPVDAMHPWQTEHKSMHNQQVAMERCAAETSGVDDGVGEIMAALKRLGLDDRTLVAYTSDQGWMGGQNGIWGMGDHVRPLGAHEWMAHIPLIFRHPGQIPPGQTSDLLVSNYDFLPSVLSYLGLGDRRPSRPPSPGRDFSDALRGRSLPWDNVVFYEIDTTRAVRTDDWKYVARLPNGPLELYDMRHDPRERFNLYGQPGMEATRAMLAQRLDAFFGEYADPQYDLWKEGRSKTRRLKSELTHKEKKQ